MYGFLVLLPLTLVSLVIGWLIGSSPQIADYVVYVTDISGQTIASQQLWMKIGAHFLAYIVVCFSLITTVRTISAPLPADRSAATRNFQRLLEIVFVALPTAVLLWINGKALVADPKNWIHWLTIGVLCVGLVTTIVITVTRRPIELYLSSLSPFSVTKVDIATLFSVIVIAAAVFAFVIDPIDSAHIIGMFPVLMLATAAAFLILAAIFSRHASPVAIISSMITSVLLLHLVDHIVFPPREFRYKNIPVKSATKEAELSVADIKRQRKIPNLATAFHQWLVHRRPAIEAYKKNNRAYPVFFASAQGGGIYAAYHASLSLARLADACPEFAHHLFGVSSVSGGSLGAAVFAELLRTLPPGAPNDPASPSTSCTTNGGGTKLQDKVSAFFKTDFLSPVVASAFIFDIPSFFIPQMRFGQDRARALEFGFETAWRRLDPSRHATGGLTANFYERWQPSGLAPALFMSTTGVNFGIPVLVSQIDWSYNPSTRVTIRPKAQTERGATPSAPSSELLQTVLDRLNSPDDQLQVGVANILDFRPDLQMATSTAIVLSARFPFVTPPGSIVENEQIDRARSIYQKTKVLELTDGAFYDNSGGIVARDILNTLSSLLERDPRFAEFKDSVRFHLIRFTDTPAKRQADASETAHFELITPLVAFDTVRQSRGVLLATPPRRTGVSNIYLLDEWYAGSLNWLLSESTKLAVETRSSWLLGYQNDVCCEVADASKTPLAYKRIPLTPEEEQTLTTSSSVKLRRFVPNAGQFQNVISLIDKGIAIPPPTAP